MINEEKSLFRHFLRGESLKRIYDVSGTVVGLANSFLTITLLSVFHYGLLQLLLSFVAILDGFNIKTIDGPITVEMRHYFKIGLPEKAKRIFKETVIPKIGLAVLVAIAVFFGSQLIADAYGEDIRLLIRWTSALLIIYALKSAQTIFLKSVMSLAHWSFGLVREIVKLGILLAAIFFYQFDILTVVAAHVLGETAAMLLIGLLVFARHYYRTFKGIISYPGFLIIDFLKTHGKWIFIGYGLSRIPKSAMPWLIKLFINTEAVALYSLALNITGLIENFVPIAGVDQMLISRVGQKQEMGFIFQRSAKYMFWAGMILLLMSWLIVPPAIRLIFPDYEPAIPLFLITVFALPIFGLFKLLKSTLNTLREYKILVMRIFNETLIIVIGLVVLLPIMGILGAGVVYGLIYIERVLFFYHNLIKKYPDFRIKLKKLFRFDKTDKEFMRRVITRSTSLFLRN